AELLTAGGFLSKLPAPQQSSLDIQYTEEGAPHPPDVAADDDSRPIPEPDGHPVSEPDKPPISEPKPPKRRAGGMKRSAARNMKKHVQRQSQQDQKLVDADARQRTETAAMQQRRSEMHEKAQERARPHINPRTGRRVWGDQTGQQHHDPTLDGYR